MTNKISSFRNMLTLVILLLGMSSIIFAETCMTLKPVDEFSMKKVNYIMYKTISLLIQIKQCFNPIY